MTEVFELTPHLRYSQVLLAVNPHVADITWLLNVIMAKCPSNIEHTEGCCFGVLGCLGCYVGSTYKVKKQESTCLT